MASQPTATETEIETETNEKGLPLAVVEEDVEQGYGYGSGYRRCCEESKGGWRPWAPVIMYAATTAMFLVAIGFYKEELFAALDALSTWLKEPANHGEAVLFCLIFVTTIPPIPLYSTLILLAGYTFGTLLGFLISYFSALSGALIVFALSRSHLRAPIQRFLRASPHCNKAIRAIERNPRLLLAVRVAPYPYNVMNVLLAGAEGMSMKVYGGVTALSLLKLVVHTWVGASLRSFSQTGGDAGEEGEEGMVGRVWTVGGVMLCVVVFVYIAWVVRKRVDGELEDGDGDEEERQGFLEEMTEVR